MFSPVVQFPSGRRVSAGKLLAEGGFSYVYSASDVGSGQALALKKMICQDPEAKAQAQTEAEMHARFSHSNLMPLLDKAFVQDATNPTWDICWLAFPLCRCSLRDEITNQVLKDLQPQNRTIGAQSGSDTRWTLPVVINILIGIAKGVQEMHRAKIAHRDLKPENVLLQATGSDARSAPFGRAVLMDFGSCGPSEVAIQSRREALGQTEIAAQFCTLQYRSPELFDIPADVHKLSYSLADVWALGCTGYCCLLGYSPFEVEFENSPPYRPRQVDAGHLRVLNPIPWPKAGVGSSSLPDWFKEVIHWILQTDVHSRPGISQVLDRLEEIAATAAAEMSGSGASV